MIITQKKPAEELLAVEADRLAGAPDWTLDELDALLDKVIEEA